LGPEFKLSFFRRLSELVLGDAKLPLILFVQSNALLQPVDEVGVRQLPQPLYSVAPNERPARGNELVGNLDEQRCESLGCVVVGRDAVDDADRADEARKHIHQRLLQPTIIREHAGLKRINSCLIC